MTEPLWQLLPWLVPAAVLMYVGTHLLWRGTGGHVAGRGFLRGGVLATPVAGIALWFGVRGAGDAGVAIILTACVLMTTLSLGACAVSDPREGATNGPSLGLLAPLSAATFLIGLSGELHYVHALALFVLGATLIWARARPVLTDRPRTPDRRMLGLATLLLVGGVVLMGIASHKMLELGMSLMAAPIVLPLLLLATIGLLVGDVHHHQGTSAAETVGGFVLAALGLALPALIVVSRLAAAARVALSPPADADIPPLPAISMPWVTWRVDSVVLLIVSLLLLPVASGRIKLARLEGLLLVAACVIYMSVTVITARS